MATHSSIPVWEIPWTEEPDGLQFMGSQSVGLDWATNTLIHVTPNISWLLFQGPYFQIRPWSQILGVRTWPGNFEGHSSTPKGGHMGRGRIRQGGPKSGDRKGLKGWESPVVPPVVCREQSRCFSVAQSCPTLCDPLDCSMPDVPVLYHLPEFAQTQVCWVNDAIQPSPLLLPSLPAFSLSQHQGLFQWDGSSHQAPKLAGLEGASLIRGASVMHLVVLLAMTKRSVRAGATQVRTTGDMIWPEGLRWRWAVSPGKASGSVPGQLTYRPGPALSCSGCHWWGLGCRRLCSLCGWAGACWRGPWLLCLGRRVGASLLLRT